MHAGAGLKGSPECHHAYVGIGSNVDPESNIRLALLALYERVPIVETSRFYRTRPVGTPFDTPDFINGAIHILSEFDPLTLKSSILRRIEDALGRKRNHDKYAPRPIDLDLLVVDSIAVNDRELTLPSPCISLYPFVAVPLAELIPQFRPPGDDRTLFQIAGGMDTIGMVYLKEFTNNLRRELALAGSELGASG